MPTGSEIRRKFLDFFVQKGHREVHSSSLVPANDPTLLFTNAGMNQFKDVFLGLEKREYNRATTSQKCVRAGGKHNDLENVGFTNRHHTFFEMLGNFSFGDYFKKDAIAYAWELVTSPQWYGIDKDKLYVTIFNGEGGIPRDAEAHDLWVAQGIAKERIFEMGLKDNFWQMGDTGPCGPCSEIHYDMGVRASDQGHTDCKFGCDCGRYVEIWNLVFMQFDRDASGKFNPLPKPSIDTGMGLERVAAVLQGVISNYDTDLFTPLIKRAAELTGKDDPKGPFVRPVHLDPQPHTAASLNVIADHARAATFLISDGMLPSNEGRGYVLRKIIRRAITHGRLLGQTNSFLNEMVFAVRDLMQDAYPELEETSARVRKVVLAEETRFAHTLGIGLEKLRDFGVGLQKLRDFSQSPDRLRGTTDQNLAAVLKNFGWSGSSDEVGDLRQRARMFPGEEAFKIFSTYGVPRDFIKDFCRDAKLDFDEEGFEKALADEQIRARASWKGAAKQTANPAYQQLPKSEFEGYRQTRSDGCEVLAIIHNGQGAQELKAGEEGEVILDHTPFYAESGGQVGDRGWLTLPGRYLPAGGAQETHVNYFGFQNREYVVADVKGCYYPVQGVRAHQVTAKQPIRVGDKVDAVVNLDIRQSTMRNHTATHLLQAGLREVLGKHVKQAGSLVAPNHLRFDFSHFTQVQDEELQDIEDLINKEVLSNEKIEVIENVPIDVAINEYHAMALFGEKYGDKVRVIKIGDFSTELCGGTHTNQTGEIGQIQILHEGSVSSGVRRIEAVTGMKSLEESRWGREVMDVAGHLWTDFQQAEDKAEAFKRGIAAKDAEIKRLARELDQVRMKSASSSTANITDKIKDVRGIKVLAHRVDNLERGQMRTLVDQLRDKIGSGVVVLGSATNGNVSLIVGVTKDLTSRVQAGKVIAPVAQKVGGKGGGRPDLAEAGGKDPAALDDALNGSYEAVDQVLTK